MQSILLTTALLLVLATNACATPPHYVDLREHLVGVNDSLFAVLESVSDNHGMHGMLTRTLNFCVYRIDDRREVHREMIYRSTWERGTSEREYLDMNLGARMQTFDLSLPSTSWIGRSISIDGTGLVVREEKKMTRVLIPIDRLYDWFVGIEDRMMGTHEPYNRVRQVVDLHLQSTMENQRGDLFCTIERTLRDDSPVIVKVVPLKKAFVEAEQIDESRVPRAFAGPHMLLAASVIHAIAQVS